MPVIIGDTAPNSTWYIAWQNGVAVTDGSTTSLSSYAGNIIVLLLADVRNT